MSKQQAEALARRGTTYADEHARSWEVRFDRRTEPGSLRELVIDLRRAYRDEVPARLHKHDVDGGGTPAYSGEFAAYLYARPDAVDREDDTYRTPFRRCLSAMLTSREAATRQMAGIVAHVTVGGEAPEDAVARQVGIAEAWCARAVAERALRVFWRRCSDVRLDLGRTETAA